jgi:dTDP-4-dehydrorhamnose 3,5-epimerase
MLFKETTLKGAFVLEIEPRPDERGFFARTFCERELAEHGLPVRFPQCNLSRNARTGTLRGMHFQAAPLWEAKLVRCVSGAIWDVIVDLRPQSPTRFGSIGVELSADNARALFVPEGFAHGFVTLQDNSDVFYHMSEFYRPDGARGLRWNDPFLDLRWPAPPRVISERDASYPDFDPAHFEG